MADRLDVASRLKSPIRHTPTLRAEQEVRWSACLEHSQSGVG